MQFSHITYEQNDDRSTTKTSTRTRLSHMHRRRKLASQTSKRAQTTILTHRFNI